MWIYVCIYICIYTYIWAYMYIHMLLGLINKKSLKDIIKFIVTGAIEGRSLVPRGLPGSKVYSRHSWHIYSGSGFLWNSRLDSLFQTLLVLGLWEARGISHSWADQRQSEKMYNSPLSTSYVGGHPSPACTSLVVSVSLGVKWGHIPLKETLTWCVAFLKFFY